MHEQHFETLSCARLFKSASLLFELLPNSMSGECLDRIKVAICSKLKPRKCYAMTNAHSLLVSIGASVEYAWILAVQEDVSSTP